MFLIRAITLIVFVLGISLFLACGGKTYDDDQILRPNVNSDGNLDATGDNSNSVTDDGLKLKKLVNLPYEPEENLWQEYGIDGKPLNPEAPAEGSRLLVVMQFSIDDTAALLMRLQANGEGKERDIDPQDWFPAEIIAKSQTRGDSAIKGVEYEATDFFRPPYSQGTITYLDDTNFFVLDLSSDRKE